MCRIGFSPRKSAFSLYVLHCDDSENKLLAQLGKIKMGQGSCIYFKKLDDLNLEVLEKLITESLLYSKQRKCMVDSTKKTAILFTVFLIQFHSRHQFL